MNDDEEKQVNNPDYTSFDEVYRVFLNMVDSYLLAQMDDEELSETLYEYLYKGLQMFSTYSVKDMFDIDTKNKRFNIKLSSFEIVTLAKAMNLAWITANKNSEELMKKAIGDRDYNAVQGYQYLDRLQTMESQLRREIKNDINEFEYADVDIYGDMA